MATFYLKYSVAAGIHSKSHVKGSAISVQNLVVMKIFAVVCIYRQFGEYNCISLHKGYFELGGRKHSPTSAQFYQDLRR